MGEVTRQKPRTEWTTQEQKPLRATASVAAHRTSRLGHRGPFGVDRDRCQPGTWTGVGFDGSASECDAGSLIESVFDSVAD